MGIRLQLVQLVPPEGQWVSDCSSSNWYRQEVSGYQTAARPTGTARRSVGIRLQLVQLVPPGGQWVSDCNWSN